MAPIQTGTTWKLNSNGPSPEPCGTLKVIFVALESSPRIFSNCVQSDKYEQNVLSQNQSHQWVVSSQVIGSG